MSEFPPVKRRSNRIGIFRRVAVEQYMRPMESNVPEMLVPWRGTLPALGVILLCVAVATLL